jgi:hypothetical protein
VAGPRPSGGPYPAAIRPAARTIHSVEQAKAWSGPLGAALHDRLAPARAPPLPP